VNSGRTVFSQLMDFLPLYEFRKCVDRYHGNWRVRSFSCLDQLLVMAFAQLTYRESLRDIEACLRAMQPKLYHMGIRSKVARTTLAEANETRDWRIYADFAHVLIARARELYAGDSLGFALEETAYALDSTVIDLCLSLFPWTKFRKNKAAIKLHTLLDLRGSIPSFIHVTNALMHDGRILDELPVEPGAIYVMDRGYLHFKRLHRLHQCFAYFVVRAKGHTAFTRHTSNAVDSTCGVILDQAGVFKNAHARRNFPAKLRRIGYYDANRDRNLIFLTNNFTLPAITIANLYRLRWHVELFFKWIKQHLRIKTFYGTSDNAVKTQIWIAICVYVLVAIVRKQLRIDASPYTILQVLSISLFEKTPISQALTSNPHIEQSGYTREQLTFFDF
jgi:hypothetical protein